MKNIQNRENVHISYDKKINEYHRIIASLAKKYTSQNTRILDIGCGLGHILQQIAGLDNSFKLDAADCYKECLNITKTRVPNVNPILMKEEFFDITLFEGKYDTCIMSHSLEHLKQPFDIVKQVSTIIRPGGHLIIAVPNPVRPLVILNMVFRKHYVNKGHVYAWDRSHFINFLENICGLKVVEYANDEVRIFPQSLSSKLRSLKVFELMLGYIFPWLSHSNIAVIEIH
ncbi:class I SAM-dependent methyltransferase [Cyanobacterium aponinum]|uniref:Methyltransferase domain-containing protein n=1 Tax=Cyanobacterium aponinum 0216 TaxID=2676140 RepID=A0A844GVJ4_9CHRO|nr:class I SAM-dependent methyltransferase [Cyanobacterium aponinum]MTF38879.1 methyltransferase domain-containing protein [Cyanobacterium aponinum 0216]